MSLKKNVIANYIGQGWSALISFIFIPIYIKYLGMESYGLIGLFSILQLALSILDSAISPSINREMSRYTGNERTLDSTRNFLRTMELTGLFISCFFYLVVLFSSESIANYWLKANELPLEVVAEAVSIAGLVVAMRFMEGIYRSVMIGLQKQVGLNVISIILNSVRNIGVIFALMYIAPTIKVFFYWQGALSIITVLSLAAYAYKLLPGMLFNGKFSPQEFKDNWRFAFGSVSNTAINFLCNQSDKIILSKYLTLSDFGNYSLGVTMVQAVTTLIMPLPQAFYPNLVRLKSLKNDEAAAICFHQCCQLINIVSGVAVATLVFFGDTIVGFWTHNVELTVKVVPVVKLLGIGAYIQQLANFPYYLPYADGKPLVNLKAHIFSLFLIIAVCLPLIMNFGVNGALWGNIIQNAGLFAFCPFFFSCYLKKEQKYWFFNDVLKPGATVFFLFYIIKYVNIIKTNDLLGFIQCFLVAITVIILASLSCKNIKDYFSLNRR